jgi:serine/threonine-protein kinase
MPEIQIEQVIEDFIARTEAGEPFDEAQCLRDHPALAEELRDFFRLHQRAQEAFRFGPTEPTSQVSRVALPTTQLHATPQVEHSAWSWNRIAEAEFPLRFGVYDLVEEINRGGMGIVYRAVHRELGRTVALKVLRAGEMATPEEVRRFRTEALASSALSHPHIIPTFEAGEEHGLFYLTMAYIEGRDLESVLREGPLDSHRAACLILKTTEAVAYAHRQSIIHRDIKPSNILVDKADEPYLADFGLAHRLAAEDGGTLTGQILGTPAYMPPEQASGRARRLTTQIDVYSLGAVLYACLTGQPPFSGPTPFDILLQVIDRAPPNPRQLNKNCPRLLESICLKAISKQPADRYASADDMAHDLRRFLRGDPIDFPKQSRLRRLATWWRREPILLSHLAALVAVAAVVGISFAIRLPTVSVTTFAAKFGLLILWVACSIVLQRLARKNQQRDWVHLIWAAVDVTIYTTLMILADAPRGLLLVGYPMMIGASGLFYRVRFVVFMTIVCMLGMMLVSVLVDDPINDRIDFLGIYFIGLLVIGLCVMTMIRRVRGLSRYCGVSE